MAQTAQARYKIISKSWSRVYKCTNTKKPQLLQKDNWVALSKHIESATINIPVSKKANTIIGHLFIPGCGISIV